MYRGHRNKFRIPNLNSLALGTYTIHGMDFLRIIRGHGMGKAGEEINNTTQFTASHPPIPSFPARTTHTFSRCSSLNLLSENFTRSKQVYTILVSLSHQSAKIILIPIVENS